MSRRSRTAALTVAAIAAHVGLAGAQTTVTTTYGQIVGGVSRYNPAISTFLGIPYASPPIGALRWASPVPPAPWSGVKNTTAISNACLQNTSPSGSSDIDDAPGSSEDCLYLNVFTPCPSNNCSLPVLFWIHGGYLTIGHGGKPLFDGTGLASLNAVVVTINYRLDLFGFLYTGAPGTDGGNFGFQDQQLALRWVQANIANFGGDPSRVTIFGESAGSWSVSAQLMMRSSDGLFRRAVLQSGVLGWWPNNVTALPYLVTANEALRLQGGLFQALGCAPGNITCARALPSAALLAVAKTMAAPTASNPFGLVFAAVRDGTLVPSNPVTALTSNSILNPNVDIIAGFNTNEGSLFVNNPQVYTPTFFGGLMNLIYQGGCGAAQSFALYSNGNTAYPGATSNYQTLFATQLKAYQAWARDYIFKCPTRTLLQSGAATLNASAPRNVYFYEFSMAPTFGAAANFSLGATHGAEIPYVFGTGMPFFTPGSGETELSRLLMASWVSFVATGNPSAAWPAGASWPAYDPTNETMVVFGPGNATALSVPMGQNYVQTSFPKTGCTFLEPTAPPPPCLSSPPSPPPKPATLPPVPPPLSMPGLPPPPPPGNKTNTSAATTARPAAAVVVATLAAVLCALLAL